MKLSFLTKKICGQISESGSHEIDFMAYGLHIDQPTAWIREDKNYFIKFGKRYLSNTILA